MRKYIKLFGNHTEYETFTGTTAFIRPNVSLCVNENEVHYNPSCKESDNFVIIGSPSYPNEIRGNNTSFDIVVHYRETHIDTKCEETIDEGTDTITVECGENPSTADSRTISGAVIYHDIEIPYSVIQSEYIEANVVAKFNVTSTSSPTKIGHYNYKSCFSAIEIDGVLLSPMVSAYTFSTTGEHTVEYKLGKSTTSIANDAFYTCSALTSVVISDGVTSIDNSAFYVCNSLTSVTIGNGVTSIGDYAFKGCYALTSITIHDSVTSIGESSFENCSAATSCTIGSGTTLINKYAFKNCSGLTTCTIGNGVTTIDSEAFYYCSGLISVTIGSGVTSIGGSAFTGCISLESITSNAITAPTITNNTFRYIKSGGTLYVPVGSSGYDTWMQNANYYLGKSSWIKVEQ